MNQSICKMDPSLFEATISGDLNTLHSLLSNDPLLLDRVSLNSVDNPLHIASLVGHINFAKQLIIKKPEFARELNEQGFSPIHIASANGHLQIVRELIAIIGNDICLLKGKDEKVSLHCAAIKGRVDVVKELVSACPESVKEVTYGGKTALHLAVKYNQIEVVRILIEEIKKLKVAEIVNWHDKDGNTLLHLATFRKQHETIAMLIGENPIFKGIDVNSVNSSGFTPMDVFDFNIQNENLAYDNLNTLEMLQRAEAMKSRDIINTTGTNKTTNLDIHVTDYNFPGKPIRLSSIFSKWNVWRELMREIEESSTDTQNALMVVAVLIATVTYQATLSPPSGFWDGDSRKSQILTLQRKGIVVGEAVMANDLEVFSVFMIFNAIGFFASLGMISMLTSEFPLRAGLRLGILSMAGTYVISVIYEAPTSMRTVFVVVGFTGVLALMEIARFVIWLMQKWGILSRERKRRRTASVGRNSFRAKNCLG